MQYDGFDRGNCCCRCFGWAKGGRVMIAIWIAIGVVAALGLATVYACIVAGSDTDDEYERWKETRHKEEDEK